MKEKFHTKQEADKNSKKSKYTKKSFRNSHGTKANNWLRAKSKKQRGYDKKKLKGGEIK